MTYIVKFTDGVFSISFLNTDIKAMFKCRYCNDSPQDIRSMQKGKYTVYYAEDSHTRKTILGCQNKTKYNNMLKKDYNGILIITKECDCNGQDILYLQNTHQSFIDKECFTEIQSVHYCNIL